MIEFDNPEGDDELAPSPESEAQAARHAPEASSTPDANPEMEGGDELALSPEMSEAPAGEENGLQESDSAGSGAEEESHVEIAAEEEDDDRVVTPIEEIPEEPPPPKAWYVLKVQSNREDSICEALMRRVAIAGLEKYFGEVIVPIERVTEFKNGKKRVVKRKLWPGYIVVQMSLTDDLKVFVRDTPGIGDFTGAGGKPTPMSPQDVAKIKAKQEEKQDEQPKVQFAFKPGDRVKVTEGTFENFEGDVESIDPANGHVTVMINIFGRSTPVELENWQVDVI